MWYLISFISCFIIDASKRKNPQLSVILIIFVIAILCFGYMTGTDWRNYEIIFYNSNLEEHFSEREPGFTLFNKLAGIIIPDFWIFNAVCKIFYIYSLIHLIKKFSNYPWSVFALTFITSSLFLIVNCPMRFMLGLAIFYLAFLQFLNRKYIKALILAIVSITFHITLIVVILLSFLGIFYNKIYDLKRRVLIIVSIIFMFLSSQDWLYSFIFNILLSAIGLESFQDSGYAFFSNGAIFTLGTIWQFFITCFIIYFKDLFNNIKFGKLIYTYSIAYFWLFVICLPIYTAFRMSLFYSIFSCISIVYILHQRLKSKIPIRYTRRIIYTFFCFLMLKSVYGSYAYYPYSNSIPYIFFGHLPYSQRDKYNIEEYSKLSGKPVETEHIVEENSEKL